MNIPRPNLKTGKFEFHKLSINLWCISGFYSGKEQRGSNKKIFLQIELSSYQRGREGRPLQLLYYAQPHTTTTITPFSIPTVSLPTRLPPIFTLLATPCYTLNPLFQPFYPSPYIYNPLSIPTPFQPSLLAPPPPPLS